MTDITSDHPAASAKSAVSDDPNVQSVDVLNDAELVIAVAHGSEDAFAEIYSRYGSSVYGLACRLCRPISAEDVTHEVFFGLWHNPDSFDPHRGSLRSHLLTDVHRRAVNLLRSTNTERLDKAQESSAHNDQGSDALSLCANESVRTLLADLTDVQRGAVLLAFFGGYTYKQIAARLHLSPETIKADLRVGLTRVRATMRSD